MVSSSAEPGLPRWLHAWIAVCALVAGLFFVSQLAEIPWRSALRGYDNTFNYLWLRSAMVDGDWDFRNDLEQCNTLTPAYRASALALPPTATGRLPNKYGIGWALVTTPFYLIADGIVGIGRSLGAWRLERDGFNGVYQGCVQLGHFGLAFAALWLAAKAVARWLGAREAAVVGVAMVWTASPLFYYQTVNLSMSHGVAFFAIAVFAYGLSRAARAECGGPSSRDAVGDSAVVASASRELGPPFWGVMRWWLLAGAGWGLAAITRFQLAAFAVAVLPALFGRGTARVRPMLWFVLGAAPFVLLQLWAWRVVYGAWFVFGYGAEGEVFHWSRPELVNVLFSSWHGLFYWHPFLLVATTGLVRWAWRERGVAAGWAIAFACALYVSAAWWCWWFASSFGNRSFDAALLPLMAGAGWLWKHTNGRWRRVLAGVAIAAGLWNFYIAALYRANAISRREPVTWTQMIEAAQRLPAASHFGPLQRPTH